MIILIALIFILSALVSYKLRSRDPKKHEYRKPPQVPGSLPLVGHVLYVGAKPHIKLMEWAKQYGSLFIVNLGTWKTLVIDDPILMKEIFSDTAFSGRMRNDVFDYQSNGHGITLGEGKSWEAHRRFTIKHLRDFGFKKNFMENLISEEVTELLNTFKTNAHKPFPMVDTFNLPVLNALWKLTAGEKLPHGNIALLTLHRNFLTAFNKLMATGVMFAPSLRHIAPSLLGWNDYVASVDAFQDFIRMIIEDHKETIDYDQPRDLIDNYLIEINNTQDTTSSFYKYTGHRNLHSTITDIFNAGSETTSTTLSWAMLFLTEYQDVQEKLYREILSVIGNSRSPNLADRPNMPYTEATICEVLRKSSMLPLGVMHKALYDKEINGHLIQKGTVIIGNLYSSHHNVKYWTDPEKFYPERFLSASGEKMRNPPAFIPFTVGRRYCLGEQFAMETMFLFITSIIQNFHICKFSQYLDLESIPGMLLNPKPFFVKINPRS